MFIQSTMFIFLILIFHQAGGAMSGLTVVKNVGGGHFEGYPESECDNDQDCLNMWHGPYWRCQFDTDISGTPYGKCVNYRPDVSIEYEYDSFEEKSPHLMAIDCCTNEDCGADLDMGCNVDLGCPIYTQPGGQDLWRPWERDLK